MTRTATIERWPVVAAAALLLALAAAFAPGAGAGSSSASAVNVVGSGTLAWKKVAVHAQPVADSKIVAVLREFRPDFSPQYVLALRQKTHRATGEPTWYRVSVPGRPNGRTGWVPAGAVELRPVRKRLVVDRSERRYQFWDGEPARSSREGRRRSAGSGDADGALLRAVEVHSGCPDSRRVRVRDERLFEALRLAGWGSCRRARDALAVAPRPGRLARVRTDGERGRPLVAVPHAAGHSRQDRPLASPGCIAPIGAARERLARETACFSVSPSGSWSRRPSSGSRLAMRIRVRSASVLAQADIGLRRARAREYRGLLRGSGVALERDRPDSAGSPGPGSGRWW